MKLLDKDRNVLLEIREIQNIFYFDDYFQNVFDRKRRKEPQENIVSFCEQYLHSLNYAKQEVILEAEYSQDLILLEGNKEEIYLYSIENGLRLKQPNLF